MKEYKEACHAMQSGVAAVMEYDPHETEPKHLRVGVNSAMVETSAIVQMLISKGVCTLKEFEGFLQKEMNNEVDRYEAQLKEHYGADIKLG